MRRGYMPCPGWGTGSAIRQIRRDLLFSRDVQSSNQPSHFPERYLTALTAWQAWRCRAGPLKGGDSPRLSYPNNAAFVPSPSVGRSSCSNLTGNQATSIGAWIETAKEILDQAMTAAAEKSWKASKSLTISVGPRKALDFFLRHSFLSCP